MCRNNSINKRLLGSTILGHQKSVWKIKQPITYKRWTATRKKTTVKRLLVRAQTVHYSRIMCTLQINTTEPTGEREKSTQTQTTTTIRNQFVLFTLRIRNSTNHQNKQQQKEIERLTERRGKKWNISKISSIHLKRIALKPTGNDFQHSADGVAEHTQKDAAI